VSRPAPGRAVRERAARPAGRKAGRTLAERFKHRVAFGTGYTETVLARVAIPGVTAFSSESA
jgi:hypothetical protein